MRVAIISDIHANRHALEAVLGDIAGSSVDEIWCLGDLVGYGAEPDACVELARDQAAICLAGNHDLAVAGEAPLSDFSGAAGAAVRWTRKAMTRENIAFIGTLTPSGEREDVGLFHGSPREPVWEYVLSASLADLCLDAQEHRVCLVGHSHVALSFGRASGEPASGDLRPAGSGVAIGDGEWLLNPGSVGQPRDGDPRAAWMLLDLAGETARFNRCEYDIAGAAEAIRAADLPASLADRLEHGQ
jgi:predicted phosphodiesterase